MNFTKKEKQWVLTVLAIVFLPITLLLVLVYITYSSIGDLL